MTERDTPAGSDTDFGRALACEAALSASFTALMIDATVCDRDVGPTLMRNAIAAGWKRGEVAQALATLRVRRAIDRAGIDQRPEFSPIYVRSEAISGRLLPAKPPLIES